MPNKIKEAPSGKAKGKTATRGKQDAGGKPNALQQPLQPSKELAAVIGTGPLPRGEVVRKGELVSVWPWLVHRHRGLWDNPDAFDPERFAPGRDKDRHRFQYLPFGGGPRVCVGARFAIVEALVILAHWLAARRFALAEGFAVDPHGSVTLRPRGGLMVEVSPV